MWNRSLKALLTIVAVAGFAQTANAQYMYLDANANGIWDAGDRLNPNGTATTVDLYVWTNQNRDGSTAVCNMDAQLQLTINVYFVNLMAVGGTVTYSNFVNLQPTMTSTVGELNPDGVRYKNGWGGPPQLAPGQYRLCTLTITGVSGSPRIDIVDLVSGSLDFTGFGTRCPGNAFDDTYRLDGPNVPPFTGFAGDFTDWDGLGAAMSANRAPVLATIGNKTVNELATLVFTATATDADAGQTLTFSLDPGSPLGATITSPMGEFSWTPSSAQVGVFPITVRVTDSGSPALSDFETVTVTVNRVNRAPTADANGPYTGSVGTAIPFDGTGSRDPDGDVLTYEWDFGDGTTGIGATASHAYVATGVYNVTLRVTDPGSLFAQDATTATISDVFDANVFYWKGLDYILPQILGTWIRMEPVSGSFHINDVLLSSLRLTFNGVTISSLCKSGIKFDSNNNGLNEIRACFRNQEIEPLFAALPNGQTTVTLTLEADLITGGRARGTTTANVLKFSWMDAGSMASVWPNPLNPQAKLSFVTLKPGITTIQVFDLNGRLVRNVMERQYLMPGPHEAIIDGRNERGNKLASGVYYYRVSSADGVTKGSFIVMK